jgi:uncharacterized protein (TIGR02996 family)
MNEDEAFIRAILAAPGDDAPRLVYADWLDERGDLRGTYLRREQQPDREHIGHSELRGLDPLWVARVSRPPLGVCCDHIHFRETGPALTSADLDRIERQLNVTLPMHYRAFLLNYNGGVPEPGHFLLEGQEPEERNELEWLLRIGAEGPMGDTSLEQLVGHLRSPGAAHLVDHDLLPIGMPTADNDIVFIGVAGDQQGHVYYYYDYTHTDNPENLTEIAPSFGQFLAMLRTYDPDWVQLIARGDLAAVERWLENGGDLDEIDPATGSTPLEHAVWSSQPAMVGLLLASGATVPRELLSVARLYGNREIVQLLTAHVRGQG